MIKRIGDKPANMRWRGVSTPAAAVIASLLDIGWHPWGPWAWESDAGGRFAISDLKPGRGKVDLAEIREALAQSLERKLWRDASHNSWNGQGLEEVPDLWDLGSSLSV